MAHPTYIQKTLKMKPETSKVFDDLDAWLDHCRFNLIEFNPADVYRSKEYKEFAHKGNGERKYYKKEPRIQRSE